MEIEVSQFLLDSVQSFTVLSFTVIPEKVWQSLHIQGYWWTAPANRWHRYLHRVCVGSHKKQFFFSPHQIKCIIMPSSCIVWRNTFSLASTPEPDIWFRIWCETSRFPCIGWNTAQELHKMMYFNQCGNTMVIIIDHWILPIDQIRSLWLESRDGKESQLSICLSMWMLQHMQFVAWDDLPPKADKNGKL